MWHNNISQNYSFRYMSLESLLKPLQWADQQVLRSYTKQAENWEEKGRSKYSLAHLYNLTATAANMTFMLQADLYLVMGTGLLAVQSLDFGRNYVKERYESEVNDGATAKAPLGYEFSKNISTVARLPMLVTGAALMIKGIAQLADYLQTKNPESVMNAMYLCSFGYALMGTASSMYVKDSDPKLLEKKPLEEFNLQKDLQPIADKEK